MQVQLQTHKPFSDDAHYRQYVFTEHNGDFEAAYEDFAVHDDDAPACCKDDFRDVLIEDDGEEVEDTGEGPRPHPDFQIYEVFRPLRDLMQRVDAVD